MSINADSTALPSKLRNGVSDKMTQNKKKGKNGVELGVEIPSGVEISIDGSVIKVKGERGELKREFSLGKAIAINQKDSKILLSSKFSRRREKEILGTTKGHIQNMINGVTKGIVYKMKIVYSHFPMTVKVQGNRISIDNFLGEKHPRTAEILSGVTVEIKGQDINLGGLDKEVVSQTAANIEQATKIRDRDPRVFQDGIYIVEKDGKAIV